MPRGCQDKIGGALSHHDCRRVGVARHERGHDRSVDDAKAVDAAGAFSVVLEMVPSDVAAQVTKEIAIPTIGIGASADCDGQVLVLDDMLVSRRHVVITAEDEGLLLRDLGSRNGTFVNGRRVEQTLLHEGDRIGIGASTFEVRDGWLVSV